MAATLASPALSAPPKPEPPLGEPRGEGPVSRRFPDLDAYLAWLEKRARLGGAWYRQIRPGVYEQQPGNFRPADGKGERKRLFSRSELEERFGFSQR